MAPDKATEGILTVTLPAVVGMRFQCYTLEPPWKDNKRRVSCIPVGTYTARYLPTAKFPRLHETEPWYRDHLWELIDVPGRSETKFHHGTSVKDTEGCPLVGLTRATNAVYNSRAALKGLHSALAAFEYGPVTVIVSLMPGNVK